LMLQASLSSLPVAPLRLTRSLPVCAIQSRFGNESSCHYPGGQAIKLCRWGTGGKQGLLHLGKLLAFCSLHSMSRARFFAGCKSTIFQPFVSPARSTKCNLEVKSQVRTLALMSAPTSSRTCSVHRNS
jgi:hypothetical protein